MPTPNSKDTGETPVIRDRIETVKRNKQRMVPKLGDVVEVPLRDGRLAYVQYVARHKSYGHLIRVLPGIFARRPESIETIAAADERYVTFFPLGAACHRKVATIVGKAPVASKFDKWPLFKANNENYETGSRLWWLWDGDRSWCVGKLRPEYYDLPIKSIPNLAQLQEDIETGWHPRDEVRERDKV